jgi:serine/threonine protein phosphatase PrpC
MTQRSQIEETTAEYSTEQLAPLVELKVVPKITVAAKTDVGRVREINQDKFEYFLTEGEKLANRGLILLVCDGMGGHAAGQVASELAAKTFIDVYLNHPATDPAVAAAAAVQAANRFVLDNARAFPARRGMGTTLSGLLVIQNTAYVIQVGDSRIYLSRGGDLQQLTMDHTVPNELFRMGAISEEEIHTHPQHHVLTRAIGIDEPFQPDIQQVDIEVGDTFMLCSDGITNHVSDDTIREILHESAPSLAAWKLVGQALVGGGSDNATAMVVRIDALDQV